MTAQALEDRLQDQEAINKKQQIALEKLQKQYHMHHALLSEHTAKLDYVDDLLNSTAFQDWYHELHLLHPVTKNVKTRAFIYF